MTWEAFFSLQGKLLYCIAPPEYNEIEFQQIGYKLQNLADIKSKEQKAKERTHKQVIKFCFKMWRTMDRVILLPNSWFFFEWLMYFALFRRWVMWTRISLNRYILSCRRQYAANHHRILISREVVWMDNSTLAWCIHMVHFNSLLEIKLKNIKRTLCCFQPFS